tara:strand:+ start:129 stop:977 length:849 start_codon:yes stop_codon:yes gene_type:complete
MNKTNGSILPTDLSKASLKDMMKFTGQADEGQEEVGLPRLSINHSAEDDEGNTLPRGYLAVRNPKTSEVVFGETAIIRPFIRLFMYSSWDNEAETFASQTVQLNTLNGIFYDSTGGERCGRLAKKEAEKLDPNSSEYALQKNVKCNQVVYGRVTIDGINARGEKSIVENLPIVWYVKGVSFIPIADFIKGLNKQKKPMWETLAEVGALKKKKGANTFYGATIKHKSNAEFSPDDKELMQHFFDGVKAFNDSILRKHREAMKSTPKESDVSLGDSLEDELGTN